MRKERTKMSPALEEIGRDLEQLRTRVDALSKPKSAQEHPFRQTAGCFTGDEDLKRIVQEIEAERSIPDPGFPDDLGAPGAAAGGLLGWK